MVKNLREIMKKRDKIIIYKNNRTYKSKCQSCTELERHTSMF